MSINVLNTGKAIAIFSTVVGVPLAGYGVYRGVMGVVHANHTMHVHQGRNITYRLNDCQVSPGGSGTDWDATVVVHNANPDTPDDYGVQVEFVDASGVPQAWTGVKKFGGDMNAGSTKVLHLHTSTNQPGDPKSTCKLVFYRGDSHAGDTSPVPMVGGGPWPSQ